MRLILMVSRSTFLKFVCAQSPLVALSTKRGSKKDTNRKEVAIVPTINDDAILRRGTCFVILQITKLSFKRRNYVQPLVCGSNSTEQCSSIKE